MFNINTLKLAVRDLAVASVLDELEDRDAHVSLPESHDDFRSFVDEVVMADDDVLLALVANVGEIIGAVSVAWQQDVWLVFFHMGLRTDESQADALYQVSISTSAASQLVPVLPLASGTLDPENAGGCSVVLIYSPFGVAGSLSGGTWTELISPM